MHRKRIDSGIKDMVVREHLTAGNTLLSLDACRCVIGSIWIDRALTARHQRPLHWTVGVECDAAALEDHSWVLWCNAALSGLRGKANRDDYGKGFHLEAPRFPFWSNNPPKPLKCHPVTQSSLPFHRSNTCGAGY